MVGAIIGPAPVFSYSVPYWLVASDDCVEGLAAEEPPQPATSTTAASIIPAVRA